MNKKIKLLTTIPLAAITAIAPFAITACNTKTKDESSKTKFKKMKFSTTTSLNDFESTTEGMMFLNTDPYHSINLTVSIEGTVEGVTFQCQYGEYDGGNTIIWPETSDWTNITPNEAIPMPSSRPIRIRAYSENGCKLSKDLNNYVNIKLSIEDQTKYDTTKGVRIGGTAATLIGKIDASSNDFLIPTNLDSESHDCEYIFNHLLYNEGEYLTSVSSNFLPFKTLTKHCYDHMFAQCGALKQVPALPSYFLAESCYESMFYDCQALEVAPHLPAYTLVKNCYKSMFAQCSSLKTISLSYIGNFLADANGDNTYFNNWVGNYDGESLASAGTIYYNGCDTEHSASAVPTNYKVIQNKDLIAQRMHTVSIEDDQSWTTGGKTCSFAPNAKKKVRAWHGEALSAIQNQISAPISSLSSFKELKYCDPTTHNPVDMTTQILEDKTLNASYLQTPYVVDANVVNIVSGYTAEEEATDPDKVTQVTITLNNVTTQECALQYRTSADKNWSNVQITGSTTTLTIHANEGLQLRGHIGTNSTSNFTNIKITGKCSLVGSIWSLIMEGSEKTGFKIPENMPDYAFYNLFEGSSGITSVNENFLLKPTDIVGATYTLKPFCYSEMFTNCTNLVGSYDAKGNVIPLYIPMPDDISEAGACCNGMFHNCSSLLKAPELPATKLPERTTGDVSWGVYEWMFYGCTSLTDGPSVLPAEYVPEVAYNKMFYQCSSLKIAPKILAKKVADGSWNNSYKSAYSPMSYMFQECSSLETTPEMKNIDTVGAYAMYDMFYLCENLKDASNITLGQVVEGAGTLQLKNACFEYMFMNCTSLKKAPNMFGIAYTQNDIDASLYKPSRYYCFKMFYDTDLEIVASEQEGYKAFFNCFDRRGDFSSVNSMFKRVNEQPITPNPDTTYYYKVN